jgi:outer membrane protein TolC
MAQLALDEQKVNVFMYDETVLRYNGMLLSVWDLLAQSSAKLHADLAVLNAQRDYFVAETNLLMTLQGLSPAKV